MRRLVMVVLASAVPVAALSVHTEARQESPKASSRSRAEAKEAETTAPVGERILDDTGFFPKEFAKTVGALSPGGKGRLVPSPTPEIAKVEKKYGKADKVEVLAVDIENGPGLLMAVHYYGDIGLGVANARVMAVLKK